MTTPDELLKMAERLEAVEAWYAETHSHEDGAQHGLDTAPLEAAALLRRLAGEMEGEVICGRCGKRFDAPQTQEVTW